MVRSLLSEQPAGERQRDLMAQADRHGLARQLSDLARTFRPARADRRLRPALTGRGAQPATAALPDGAMSARLAIGDFHAPGQRGQPEGRRAARAVGGYGGRPGTGVRQTMPF